MKTKTAEIQRADLTMDDLVKLLDRTKAVLAEEDYRILEKLVSTLVYLSGLLEKQGTTVKELRKLLFGLKSEKLSKVLGELEAETPAVAGASSAAKTEGLEGAEGEVPGGDERKDQDEGAPERKRKGHGRNGADAYAGAERVRLAHETLKPGDPCPEQGCTGKVYELSHPSVLVRIVGRSPLGARVIEMEQLRCNLCLKVFTAKAPEDAGPEKYDATAASMIALLRYGTGVPFNRLEGLQGSFGIPLPASTQWDVVERAFKLVEPAYQQLIQEAAQGDVLHNDDTPMKILELMKKKEKREKKSDDG